MDLQIKGKKALITGSTLGIGFATASALAAEGAIVYINGRKQETVDQAVAKIKTAHSGADVHGIALDLGSADGVAKLVAQLDAVDILVNNLGIFEPKEFEAITDEDWLRFFEVNVMSGVRLSRAYLKGMKQKNWGRIIFVSSESGLQIPAEMVHYGMTKTAQISIARGIAESVAGTGITVNSVLPGPTGSEGVADFIDKMNVPGKATKSQAEFEREFIEMARPSSLIKRLAKPEEVANLIAYLCSPLASATTGASVRVDGGVVRSIG